MDADRNLLFAVLALQADFLTRDQFVDACALWAGQKDRPIANLLVDRGWLGAADRATVDALMARKLARHVTPRAALATVTTDGVRASLAGIDDRAIAAALPAPPSAGHVLVAAISPTDGGSRYTLSRLHATGGIGQVWLARDERFGREVALKELRGERTDNPVVAARFLREAKVTGQLEHPGIVPVYELGTRAETGEPFYTMRFVRGRTLGEAVHDFHARRREGKAGALEFRDLLSAFVGVCHAVAYAHSRGVLHRDLKPANVVLGDFGEVILLDWGLARLYAQPDDPADPVGTTLGNPLPADGGPATVHGQVLGTPAYMSPEQAAGELARIGPAADVYGLGAVLYEVLTGQPPFLGTSSDDVLRQVRETDPPPPRALSAWVPRALDAVCRKAMAKEPGRRYATATTLADEMRHFLADEPVAAHRERMPARAGRWARRHRPLVAGLATAALLVVAAGATYLSWHQRRAREVNDYIVGRESAAHAAIQAGDIETGITRFDELVAYCDAHGRPPDRDRAAAHRAELRRFLDFRTKAAAALRDGAHNVRSKERPDPVLARSEVALAVYGLADPGFRQSADWAPTLTTRQRDEVIHTGHELLVLSAIRLAMFDTRDEAAKEATRRALGLLDRAAALVLHDDQGRQSDGASAGIWLMRMLWHRRLGHGAEADAAGERSTALVKADGGFKSARDYYLFGSVTLQLMKKPKEAMTAYRRALTLDPGHYGALFGLYLCATEANDLVGQVAALTGCMVSRPNEPELYYFRGMAYFEQQQFDAAYHDFNAAVARNPTFKTGYFYRGRMLVVKQDWAAAEKDFARAVELDPTFVQARSWWAVALAKGGRHREAAAEADRTAASEPTDRLTVFFSARAYAQAVAAVPEKDPDREALVEGYGRRSVELLRQAFANGFTDTGRLAPGGDFTPIRDRADFQELLKTAPKPKKGD